MSNNILLQISNFTFVAISGCYMSLLTIVFWLGRTKVSNKTCDIVRENNKTDHENIRKWIKDSEKRAKDRHIELKIDLKEFKDLIRNNGKRTPRIRT